MSIESGDSAASHSNSHLDSDIKVRLTADQLSSALELSPEDPEIAFNLAAVLESSMSTLKALQRPATIFSPQTHHPTAPNLPSGYALLIDLQPTSSRRL
jgi:hypothetical protein